MIISLREIESSSLEACMNQESVIFRFLHLNRKSFFEYR